MICIVLIVASAAMEYVGLFSGVDIFLKIASDIRIVLSYIATAVVSSVFTKFFGKKPD
jgi:hypothetical protein